MCPIPVGAGSVIEMAKPPRILVVGSFVMDLIVTTEVFPGSGETVLGKSFATAPGGKGANQAVQAARLGADVTMIGKVGDDEFGRTLVHSCEKAGINTQYVTVAKKTASAVGDVLLEEVAGKGTTNRIIVVSGANMSIGAEDISFVKEIVDQYAMVMLQLEIPMEINELVVEYASSKGVPVMLNSAPASALSDDLLAGLSYISPNEHEIQALTGIPIRKEDKRVNRDDLRAAAEVLLKKGVKNVLVTLGNGGSALINRNEFLVQPCIDVVDVKDPTAAGDSFVAAFVSGLGTGMNHEQALLFASYTAALTVSRPGAQPSLPYLSAVTDLMAKGREQGVEPNLLDVLKG